VDVQQRPQRLPLSLRHGVVPFLLVLATVSVATLATAPASAAKRAPTPSYSAAFKKLDTRWWYFTQAEKTLAVETGIARTLCQQAEDWERDPKQQKYAPLIWRGLKTAVDTGGRPTVGKLLGAKHAALNALESLHSIFAKLWARRPARLRVLNRGTMAVLHADSFYSSGLDEIETALNRWSRPYLCESAQKHVDIANRLMPKGDDALNDGMARLKSLR